MNRNAAEEIKRGVMNSLLLRDTFNRLEQEEGINVRGDLPIETHLDETEVQDFSPQIRTQALKMQSVYVNFFCLENAARELIAQRLLERHGAGWWDGKVPEKIQKNVATLKKKEDQNKYLSARSSDPIGYTFFGNLAQIIISNWDDFSDLFPDQAWITSRFNDLEICRNVLMHTNVLPPIEVSRIESLVRDWLSQVG
jgi:hypothetical protein